MNSKKCLILVLFCIIGGLLLFGSIRSHDTSPKTEVLINHFEEGSLPPFPTLFYSDINYTRISGYDVADDTLLKKDVAYTPYTEGFLPTTWYNAFSGMLTSPAPSPYFHDYYLDHEIAVLAFTGDLNAIYLVDLQKETASPLLFEPYENLGKMYVSHMKRVGDRLIILGGEANAHASLIYTVDLNTHQILTSKRLINDPQTLYEDDFTILDSGWCLFTAGTGIQAYQPFTDTEKWLPLDFPSTQLLSYGSHALVFSQSEDTLSLVQDTHTRLPLPLPTTTPHIVDMVVKDDYLFLALYDSSSGRFNNYLSVYDLRTGKWMYALGIEPMEDVALLAIQ